MANPLHDHPGDAARLRAIAALELLDTPPEREFDALAALAAQLLDCPIGLVTIVAGDRQWVKAGYGTDLKETTRETAFCDHTIRSRGSMIVEDAASDPRFADHPLVTQPGGIRFYAGVAIDSIDPETNAAVPIGAVCAIDTRPRPLDESRKTALHHLATLAESMLSARLAASEALAIARTAEAQAIALRRQDSIFRQAERMAKIGSWRMTLDDHRLEWSDGVFGIYDLPNCGTPSFEDALAAFPPHARPTVTESLQRAIETGAAFDYEADFTTATGRQRRVRAMGECEIVDGRQVAVVGTFQDVTERHVIEESLRRSASVDSLTRVANRAAFNVELERAMACAREDASPLALLLVDLDHFKAVNDTHGHLVGDDVLRAFGRRLRAAHAGGFAARIGGDEFALIVSGIGGDALDALVRRLLAELKQPVATSAGTIPVSGTIGYAPFDDKMTAPRELVHAADTALYAAKRRQRGTAERWGRLRATDKRAA